MSILVYTESQEGKFKKHALEAVSFAREIANQYGTDVIAVSVNAENLEELGKYGVNQVYSLKAKEINHRAVAQFIAEKADGAVVFSHSAEGTSIASQVAVKLESAIITNILEKPQGIHPLVVKRTSFSGKALAWVETRDETPVLTLAVNAFGLKENPIEIEVKTADLPQVENKIKVENIVHDNGQIDLKEAERVVSGGRGLKGPENWGMIEELAQSIEAATACSKPVSDMGWRPHSEHVGQTGKAIAPNLYLAIGISGAIQHLAGVNSSKTIVVINNDPEAPFFKSADYGIVGDAFEVVPKLTEAIKKLKA
ncbi:Electron transfer flavoprotein large subunit [Candidatus Ornithobacterium hominis]|uniref:electron transfer flavoprotein subunit alpha/FixB family protein n=1 Tax=Candidatus Ornithobacterium hominis TaxID=2497989 RepID=UPI0024BD2996|nr:electron transfer flavoprotein subunit alpha/FixB family protein [Candidatus Ornithobacterium hominis]CAI9429532.1 Electron transfer flavoprotein large subunit [Candidatus Ornithobacterium hominis]